ncbi:hypothetical protein JCM19231_2879 [Vibrio ishigakensis]|uniref:Uncharacterized protein n=1 Tax=Vibrio ishigakensis TaxID=1481914 RepID=A0A0B8NYP8_9VIBR|nr:hypothetical protein JCM19231_2879 [Vibrio ishigakensis]
MWALPILALLLGGWLMYKNISESGIIFAFTSQTPLALSLAEPH